MSYFQNFLWIYSNLFFFRVEPCHDRNPAAIWATKKCWNVSKSREFPSASPPPNWSWKKLRKRTRTWPTSSTLVTPLESARRRSSSAPSLLSKDRSLIFISFSVLTFSNWFLCENVNKKKKKTVWPWYGNIGIDYQIWIFCKNNSLYGWIPWMNKKCCCVDFSLFFIS